MSEPPLDSPAPAGTEASPTPEDLSLTSLLTLSLESLLALLAGKIRLLEMELTRDLATLRTAAGLLAGLGLLIALTLVFAGAGAAFLLGEAMGSTGGGFLAVTGLYLFAALIVWAVLRRRLRRLGHFLQETRADLKRDVEWLKNLP